jgi:outer membrane protein OmpA-like peptidoglycan-associated protein
MTWSKRALSAVVLAFLSAGPAGAQIAGHPVELSGGAGVFSYDARSRVKLGPAYNGALGWRWMPWMTLEGQATFGPSKEDFGAEITRNFMDAGLDLRWNLRPGEGRVVPFILSGMSYATSHAVGLVPDKLERGAPSLGAGVLWNVRDQRTYVRLQVRDVMFRERESLEFANHVAATLGLQYNWGGKARDQDLDGVRDWLDHCPNTPIGAKVDKLGCPIDSDRDSVYDGLDKCEGTPFGCKVDRNGCPLDADNDGVCDGLDQCADTPKGATVDARGCPSDTDGDGVLDGIDKCPDTPKGAKVDATGCPIDSDGDGVPDGLDECPDTKAGLKVDATGCPIEISEKVTELLDTGMIRLRNINFDTGKATIKPESFPILDDVGAVLLRFPTLKIEIGGHTDNRGGKAMNDKLSQARSTSVLNYIRQKFPTLDPTAFTAKGYGYSQPLASNSKEIGRALNRRVEFKVLNPEALKIEREKRRFLQKGEPTPVPNREPSPVPVDTTGHSSTPPDTVKHEPAPRDTTKP